MTDAPVRPDSAHPLPCRIWSVASAKSTRRSRCGWPATAHVRTGCVHEHIWEGWVCERHAASGVANDCGACFVLDGHVCPVAKMPLAGDAA